MAKLKEYQALIAIIFMLGGAVIGAARAYDAILLNSQDISELNEKVAECKAMLGTKANAIDIKELNSKLESIRGVIGNMQSDVALICLKATGDIRECRTSTGRPE